MSGIKVAEVTITIEEVVRRERENAERLRREEERLRLEREQRARVERERFERQVKLRASLLEVSARCQALCGHLQRLRDVALAAGIETEDMPSVPPEPAGKLDDAVLRERQQYETDLADRIERMKGRLSRQQVEPPVAAPRSAPRLTPQHLARLQDLRDRAAALAGFAIASAIRELLDLAADASDQARAEAALELAQTVLGIVGSWREDLNGHLAQLREARGDAVKRVHEEDLPQVQDVFAQLEARWGSPLEQQADLRTVPDAINELRASADEALKDAVRQANDVAVAREADRRRRAVIESFQELGYEVVGPPTPGSAEDGRPWELLRLKHRHHQARGFEFLIATDEENGIRTHAVEWVDDTPIVLTGSSPDWVHQWCDAGLAGVRRRLGEESYDITVKHSTEKDFIGIVGRQRTRAEERRR